VYTELLDFGGDEIYFKEEPALIGKTFGEALLAYEDSAVLGIKAAHGAARLNPPMDTPIQSGDALIAVSEDDDTIILSQGSRASIDESALVSSSPSQGQPTRILVLGWNATASPILREIDNYVTAGSQVMVVADDDSLEGQVSGKHFENLALTFRRGDFSERRTLEAVQPGAFERIILLASSERLDPQQADALTLVTLLHLRDLADRNQYNYAIVSQILDARNRALAEVTRADDFIVSDKLASLMLSQIAENKHLNAVFADLFDPEGSEIYLKPAGEYVEPGKPVNFYTVVEAARRRGQVAFGYRLKAQTHDIEHSYGVVVNPKKSELVTYSSDDKIILLSDN
jgi:hypothetical protein